MRTHNSVSHFQKAAVQWVGHSSQPIPLRLARAAFAPSTTSESNPWPWLDLRQAEDPKILRRKRIAKPSSESRAAFPAH